ncbi:MAG: ABC transporter ATP-binding protein [Candidatus Omnitrophota bacterium]
MDILKIKGLNVSFEKQGARFSAVIDAGFSVGADEAVGLVGESGSGKTVTGLSVMRILPHRAVVESGSIMFDGEEIVNLPEKRMRHIRGRGIGMVFQEPFTSLNPVFTVGSQIDEVFLAHKKMSAREARDKTVGILGRVRMNDPERVYYSYPHRLSGGERQRVMIAMAVALEPKLLIADEPTTALDVTVQAGIIELLRELRTELGMSILFITHDFGIINSIADRVVVMKSGRVIEQAPKDVIMKSPAHEYTKELIAAAGILSFGGKKKGGGDNIILEAVGVTKTFAVERGFMRKRSGSVRAVNNVSMSIRQARTMGLVGETGCGKTTFGRLVLGLEKPDSGDIIVDGESIMKGPPRRVREMMQIVFQDPYGSLDPRMRMGDIVLEGADLLGLGASARKKALGDALERVKLSPDDAAKYPHQFSGGQRQRIAIARALAVRPRFLVLDEPVSSLDMLIQRDILALLEDLKREMGLTYLFISHDLRVIESISDDVCVMKDGEIVESGPCAEVYNNPGHPYTKKLIASIPQL